MKCMRFCQSSPWWLRHTQTDEVYKTWEHCKYSFLLQHIPFSFKTSYSLLVLADYRMYLLDEPHVYPGNLHPELGIASSPAFIPKSPHSLQAIEVCRDWVSVFKEKFILTVLGTVRNMAALWKCENGIISASIPPSAESRGEEDELRQRFVMIKSFGGSQI